jgi:hypothetical protein
MAEGSKESAILGAQEGRSFEGVRGEDSQAQ